MKDNKDYYSMPVEKWQEIEKELKELREAKSKNIITIKLRQARFVGSEYLNDDKVYDFDLDSSAYRFQFKSFLDYIAVMLAYNKTILKKIEEQVKLNKEHEKAITIGLAANTIKVAKMESMSKKKKWYQFWK